MLCCRTNRVTGVVKVNGVERDIHRFRRDSSYIMQDDELQPLLTVHEAMSIAANLKLGAEFSPKHKMERVSCLIHTLALRRSEIMFNYLTNKLTPWSRVLPEKLVVLQLNKKFLAFYGTRRFITTFTTACHLSLS
jgi:hypothetical protein